MRALHGRTLTVKRVCDGFKLPSPLGRCSRSLLPPSLGCGELSFPFTRAPSFSDAMVSATAPAVIAATTPHIERPNHALSGSAALNSSSAFRTSSLSGTSRSFWKRFDATIFRRLLACRGNWRQPYAWKREQQAPHSNDTMRHRTLTVAGPPSGIVCHRKGQGQCACPPEARQRRSWLDSLQQSWRQASSARGRWSSSPWALPTTWTPTQTGRRSFATPTTPTSASPSPRGASGCLFTPAGALREGGAPQIPKNRLQHVTAHPRRSEILYLVENHSTVVLIGETGSGKTTQVPQYLREAGWTDGGRCVVCTQPRCHACALCPPASLPQRPCAESAASPLSQAHRGHVRRPARGGGGRVSPGARGGLRHSL